MGQQFQQIFNNLLLIISPFYFPQNFWQQLQAMGIHSKTIELPHIRENNTVYLKNTHASDKDNRTIQALFASQAKTKQPLLRFLISYQH